MALWVVIPIQMVCLCLLIMTWARQTKAKAQTAAKPERPPPFSASDYLERIEKASIEILAGLEQEEKYTLILWAGLDGLRLNEDGTQEWIKRDRLGQANPRKSLPTTNIQPYVPCNANYYGNLLDTRNAITSLQAQNTAPLFECLQTQQSQNIINALRPSYMQSPIGYDTSLTQCCCNLRL